MALKNNLSKIFANSKKRAYTKLFKNGKQSKDKKVHRHLILMQSGNTKLTTGFSISLISKETKIVVDKLCEKARVLIVRGLSKSLNKSEYKLKFEKYPHIILRQHAMLTGAGADRLTQGMKNAFGKPVLMAARSIQNDPFLTIYVSEKNKDKLVQVEKILNSAKPWFPFTSYLKKNA